MIDTHHIKVSRTARVYTMGNLSSPSSSYPWYMMHGYGQHAYYFIRKMEALEKEHFVVAPEGLSKFYVSGLSGKVGASWMTKEMRLEEINDYLQYLDQVYNQFFDQQGMKNPLSILGFSQGCATASRWAIHRPDTWKNIVFWSGFPAEEFWESNSIISKNIFIVLGKNDEFYNYSDALNKISEFKEKHSEVKLITFDGTHEIKKETIQDVFLQIKRFF